MVKFCVVALLVMLAWLSPATAWASSSPALLAEAAAAVDATPKASFSDTDIATFAKAYQEVQLLRMGAEREMAEAVEDEGLTIERFNAIAEIQLGGQTQGSEDGAKDDMAKIIAKAKVSGKERKQFDAVVERIIAIRQSTEEKMETAIEAEGLSIETFNGILEQSASDTDLQRTISDQIVKQTLTSSEPAS